MGTPASPDARIEAIDLARGVAMVAMAVFHFAWDLEYFGYAAVGMTREPGWMLFARAIASAFLFLVGVGLFLAHRRSLRARSFLTRLMKVAGAAIMVSTVTWIAVPQGFIFFGILHQIAFASVAGLAFLRAPVVVTICTALFVILAPRYFRHEVFDHPAWWWVGLSPIAPVSFDYVPLFPWFGAVLLGISAARITDRFGVLLLLSKYSPGPWSWPVRFVGRHGLPFYLLHQPVLIGAIWLFANVWPTSSGLWPSSTTQWLAAG